MVKEYYQVLGLTRGADEKEIKQAYRKLALKFHPDKNAAEDAEERFKEIGEAYEVLSDEEKKAAYEESLDSERWKPGPGPSNYSSSSFSHNYDPFSTFNRVFATDPFCDSTCDEGLRRYRQARYDRYNAYRGFPASNTGRPTGSDYAGQGASSFSFGRTREEEDTSTLSSSNRFDDVLKRMQQSDREAAYKPDYSFDSSEPLASREAFKPTYRYDSSEPLVSSEAFRPAYRYDSSDVKEEVEDRETHQDFSDNETFHQPSSVFTNQYSSDSQDTLDENPTQPTLSLGGNNLPTYNSYQRREDDIYERPVINFDPTFNPRKYLYDDDCDVDEILKKIRGEKKEATTDSLRFREVEAERPSNLFSTSPFSSQSPSFSSQIPSHSPPPPSSSHFPSNTSSLDRRVDCPICGLAFHQDIIERHAANCGDF